MEVTFDITAEFRCELHVALSHFAPFWKQILKQKWSKPQLSISTRTIQRSKSGLGRS